MTLMFGKSGLSRMEREAVAVVVSATNECDYMTLMFGKSGLSRMEREAVAVVVSATNECDYCVNHHTEALRHFIDDQDALNMLMTADGLETLEPRLSNIVRYAEKLTTAPGAKHLSRD
jgi:uncharacterized peroxidase-related enzyme